MQRLNIKHTLGNTYYFDFKGLSIPFYYLNNQEIVLLDSGYKINGDLIRLYMKENGLRLRAVIHSHIHIDHISGNLAFYEDPDVLFYGPREELQASLNEFQSYTNTNEPPGYYNFYNAIKAIQILQDRMQSIDHSDHVQIENALFQIFPSRGHTPLHKLIVTPDQVCYLGDALLSGHFLASAKVPYAADLIQDIQTMKTLKRLPWSYYIAAHEGTVMQEDLESVLQDNLSICRHLLYLIDLIRRSMPDANEEETINALIKMLEIHNTGGLVWLRFMLHQYIEFYENAGREPELLT